MASEGEPRLCPGCPRKKYLALVRQTSYTTTAALETTTKLCSKLRALDVPGIRKCPYFNENETLVKYYQTTDNNVFRFPVYVTSS